MDESPVCCKMRPAIISVCLEADLPRSNIAEQCWVWKNEGQEYFYDKHEWVRVRVEQEHWHDQSPVAPSEREAMSAQERKSPYSITVRGFTPGKEKLELTVIGIDDAVGIGSY